MADGIEHKITQLQLRGLLDTGAAEHRADTGGQLLEMERLRQIVIRAGIQTNDLVLGCPLGSQDEHRGGNATRTQLAKDRDPVATWEHEVENDTIVLVVERLLQPRLPIVGALDRVVLLVQPLLDKVRHLLLILDD